MIDLEKFNADLKEFNEQSFPPEKEILVLIEETTNGAMLFGQSWVPSNHPMAFIDLETGVFTAKPCRLEWLVEGKNWKYFFTPQKGYRLKVRTHKPEYSHPKLPTFTLVEILEEDVTHEKFTKFLQKYNKEVVYQDADFDLKLDKPRACFEGKHLGQNISFSVETESLRTLKRLLKKYQSLTQNYPQWISSVKEFCATQLLDLANDWAKHENEHAPALTAADFIAKIEISSVYLHEEGFILYFDDGDLFFQHAICVSGTFDGILESATIEG